MQSKIWFRPINLLAILGLLLGVFIAMKEWFFHSSFSTNDSLVWTLPLVSYIFLALLSTGVSILLSVGKIAGIKVLESQTKVFLCIAIGALLGAFSALATEMGSPLNLFWMLFSPNLASPIWWMGMLYFVELILLGIKFAELYRGKQCINAHVLAYLTLGVAICASLVLGSVFGTIIGRASYTGLSASVFTFLCALASGIAVVAWMPNKELQKFISSKLCIAAITLFVFLLAKYIYQMHSTVEMELASVPLICLLLLLGGVLLTRWTLQGASILTLLGVFYAEYSFVLSGQIYALGPKKTWFGVIQNYVPNFSELAVFIFGISVAWIVFTIGKQMLVSKPS